jgi:hypothetical protein
MAYLGRAEWVAPEIKTRQVAGFQALAAGCVADVGQRFLDNGQRRAQTLDLAEVNLMRLSCSSAVG